jgi:hypothetical protein
MNMPTYMMATKATHKLGDLSRKNPELACIQSEDEDNYYGYWIEGLGFIDVQFPKSTTRELTEEEKVKFSDNTIVIEGFISEIPSSSYKLQIE